VVTRPVLELLDADYLAEPKSTLFIKEFRQQKDFHGRRVKRLNATMDEAKFDELTYPLLHELLQGENDPKARHSLKQRYRLAMMKVVKKRRANHVQKWRTLGHPMRMIYGGADRFQHLFVKYGGAEPDTDISPGNGLIYEYHMSVYSYMSIIYEQIIICLRIIYGDI
jgi:hypothetical protein